MRYAVTFILLGACFVALAIQTQSWGWLFLWPGAGALLVGLGYAGLGSRVFGKRAAGCNVAALDGPRYVHCAQGHGRSAALVAAVLIARGLAADVDAAERQMTHARPRVGLKPVQRALVRRLE